MEKIIMNIACSLDSKYTRFAGVLLVSIFENNKDESVVIHVLGQSLREADKSDLREIADRYNQVICFYDVDESLFAGFSVNESWALPTYFRLIIPDLVAESVHRILYLDCDMICRGSLRDLFEEDLNGYVIGAVEDPVISPRLSLCHIHGINPDYFYFNAGMLLVDLDSWRKHNLTRQCFEYLNSFHPMHLDQDTLNYVLQGKWKHLSYRWNYMADFHSAYFNEQGFEMDMKKTYPYYPRIIHFTGIKPWNHASRSCYKADFYHYQALTKWREMKPNHTIKEWFENVLREFCDKTGLKKKIPFKRYDFRF